VASARSAKQGGGDAACTARRPGAPAFYRRGPLGVRARTPRGLAGGGVSAMDTAGHELQRALDGLLAGRATGLEADLRVGSDRACGRAKLGCKLGWAERTTREQ
jgi:hypothetical protein